MKETCGRWRRHWQARIHKQTLQKQPMVTMTIQKQKIQNAKIHKFINSRHEIGPTMVRMKKSCLLPEDSHRRHSSILFPTSGAVVAPSTLAGCLISRATDGRKKPDKKANSEELNLPHIHLVNQGTDQNCAHNKTSLPFQWYITTSTPLPKSPYWKK